MSNFYKLNGSKYAVNHDFFTDIETEEQAYLLGFFVADGNINLKRKTFRIKISKTDSEIIDFYKKYISPESKVYIVSGYDVIGRCGKKYKGNDQIVLDINSSKLVNSLVNINFGYNKTYEDLRLPNISDDLIRHFIRGYFDGDGSISIWNCREKGKSDRVRCKVDFSNKKYTLLNDIKCFLESKGIKININYIKRDDMFRLCTSSKSEIKKIHDLFYNDSSLCLCRKKDKFSYFVNSEIIEKTTRDRNA